MASKVLKCSKMFDSENQQVLENVMVFVKDNIIEKGKAKLSLWLALAEKLGTVCEEA